MFFGNIEPGIAVALKKLSSYMPDPITEACQITVFLSVINYKENVRIQNI